MLQESGNHSKVRIPAASGGSHNRFSTVLFSGFHHFVGNDINCLIPADAFPFILPAFSRLESSDTCCDLDDKEH